MNKKEYAKDVVWDLTEYYSGIKDPKIEKDLEKAEELVDEFVKKYKGKINSSDLTAEFLKESIEDEIEISYQLKNLGLYTSLLHSKNSTSEEVGAFYQMVSERLTELSSKLVWYGVEWLLLENSVADKIIKDPLLLDFRYSLEHSRVAKPHTLSEKEEVLLTKTSLSGPAAFVRLFDLVDTDAKYELEVEGEVQKLTFSQLAPFLTHHEDREVRRSAAKALTEGLKKNERIYSFTLNTLLLDSKIEDEIRSYKYPQQAAFQGDDLSKETVETMVKAVESNYGVVEDFYNIKRKLMGVDKLFEWDRYNPIFPDASTDFEWEEAKKMVLNAFYNFDEEFGKIGEMFFDKGWIDAPVLEGKRSGAFCSLGSPKHHPNIFLNYRGKSSDVTALAHELGHGIHAYLGRKQSLPHYFPSTPIAEVASVFGELLVFDDLLQKIDNKEAEINLLSEKLQDSFATVFRQTAFYLFESDIHEYRRKAGELSIEKFNDLYQKRLQKMFGNALSLTDDHKYWWMYVSHFYHYDFYVYSYAFGELLTLALYKMKEEEGFAEKYVELLKLAGSKSPRDLLKTVDVDIEEKGFWDGGFEVFSDLNSKIKILNQE